MKPDVTIFSLSALDLDAAAADAVEHLTGLVEAEGMRGFVAPVLVQESFERVDGVWTRVFKFQAELLPERP